MALDRMSGKIGWESLCAHAGTGVEAVRVLCDGSGTYLKDTYDFWRLFLEWMWNLGKSGVVK